MFNPDNLPNITFTENVSEDIIKEREVSLQDARDQLQKQETILGQL